MHYKPQVHSTLLAWLKSSVRNPAWYLSGTESSFCPQSEDFKADGQKILADFHDWVRGGASGAEGWTLEKENHEGWRVSIEEGEGKRGWALLRASLHDPLLVLNVESDVRGGEQLLWLYAALAAAPCIDGGTGRGRLQAIYWDLRAMIPVQPVEKATETG